MDFLVPMGVDWIIAIQSMGVWLEAPMEFFSFLGTEDFFFLVLPLIYWCLDANLGLRVGFILITSNVVNNVFKLMFAGPRPYWVSDKVLPLSSESTFGVPSGHAQNAVSIWGIMASNVRKRWAWGAALTLAFLIGFSRWYLGMHFPHDVFLGWLLGGILLWAFMQFWDPVEAWLKQRTFGNQILIALIVSLIFIALGAVSVGRLDGYTFPEEWRHNALRAGELPAPVSIENSITSAGTLFGLAVGAAWIAARGGYQTAGPVAKRALRYVIGLIGVVILWMGLGAVFPDNADLISYLLRYVRYSLVGFWVSAGAPWLFFRFKLADNPKL
jgi:membrane-associated phospholipid phosphatase